MDFESASFEGYPHHGWPSFFVSNFLDGTLDLYAVPDYETLKSGNGERSKVYKAELKK